MFVYQKQLQGILHNFFEIEKKIYFLNSQGGIGVYFLDTNKLEQIILEDKLRSPVLYANEYILVKSIDSSSVYFFLLKSKEFLKNKLFKFPELWRGIVHNYLFFTRIEDKPDIGIYDLNEKKILWSKDITCGRTLFITIDIIFLTQLLNDNLLLAFSTDSGFLKWQFDATDLGRYRRNSQSPEKEGKVEKIIGVYQDLLIVAITNSTILAIDIHTGELKGKWRDLPEGQSYGKMKRTTLVYPFQSFIDQSAGKLIGLIGSYYWEIDLHGDTIYFHDATEEFKKHQVGTHTSGQITPQGDHILFASEFFSPSSERIQKVAAFNRKTKLIDWSYTFEDLAPTVMPKAPVVEGNRMYVLDTGGTLHVFEKEDF